MRIARRVLIGSLVAALSVVGLRAQQAPDEPFHQAIRQNDLNALRRLAGDATSPKSQTALPPLMLAAGFGSAEAVRILLESGANPNVTASAGATPLHYAVRDVRKVQLLLGAGADVHARSQLGRTPLLVAASVNGTAEVVRLLLDKGAAVNIADNTGMTPLGAAAAADDLTVASLLLARGADPNAGEPVPAQLPLGSAASHGNVELVRQLLARGADVNAHSSARAVVKNGPIQFGEVTALHSAVLAGSAEIVTLLLDAGATVDARDVRGMTPLMWAVANDRPQVAVINMLLARGADSSRRSKIDESAIDWARKFNNPAVLSALHLPTEIQASAKGTVPVASHGASTARDAVGRSLPLLRLASGRVMTDGGCVACHAQPMSAIAANLAAERGWQVGRADSDIGQATVALTAVAPSLMQAQEGGGRPDGQLFIAMMMAELGMPASLATDALVHYMAAKQRAEGNWHTVGGTRAPIQDGDFLRTAFAIRLLRVYGAPAIHEQLDGQVQRAVSWLARQTPVTTQDWTMQLLGLHWADAQGPVRDTAIRELLALQRSDGGWAQTPYLESDAYATGQVLYALRQVGLPETDTALQRGVTFLLRTQREDGSWYVRNRAMKLQPYFESGFPYGHDQWISQTGTSWAVIGLSAAAQEAALAADRSR